MGSDDKFWLTFWRMAIPAMLLVALCIPVLHAYRGWLDVRLIESGVTPAEVWCHRRATSSTATTLICLHVFLDRIDHQEAMELLDAN